MARCIIKLQEKKGVIRMDFETIVEVYQQTASTKETARLLNISEVKVRRVLITLNLWRSNTSNRIGDLWRKGMTVKEIARQLNMSEKNVQAYLPYTKGIYGGQDKSAEAIRAEAYRIRLKKSLEKQVVHVPQKSEKTAAKQQYEERGIAMNTAVGVMRLHLELNLDDLSPREMEILQKYGKVEKGVMRDVLVPDTMTLHALHYVIQKVFGWQNSHLHHFSLPEEIFQMCTEGSFGIWTKLCGVYFRFPTDDLEDLYWDDDYDGRYSVNTWYKRKYCGPYRYEGNSEYYLESQLEVRDFYRRFKSLEILRPWNQWDGNEDSKIEKVIAPNEATIEEVFRSIIFEAPANSLLERLTLREVLCSADQIPSSIDPNSVATYPMTNRLVYEYDYGDGWVVNISLIEDSEIPEELCEQVQMEKPICAARDGINIMDDVGGVFGFCEFLEQLHEGDPEEREQLRQWAKMFAWTGRMTKPENML